MGAAGGGAGAVAAGALVAVVVVATLVGVVVGVVDAAVLVLDRPPPHALSRHAAANHPTTARRPLIPPMP